MSFDTIELSVTNEECLGSLKKILNISLSGLPLTRQTLEKDVPMLRENYSRDRRTLRTSAITSVALSFMAHVPHPKLCAPNCDNGFLHVGQSGVSK